ncbi:MAG: hypothetical protein ABIK65_11990 [Candidatus Eisenbacteria bacterium]
MKRLTLRAVLLPVLLPVLLGAGCGGRASEPLVLYDFEKEADQDRVVWKCHALFDLSGEWAASGGRSLRCDLMDEQYPGVSFREFERDWSPYRALSFHVRHTGADTLNLVVRVDDPRSGYAFENRYNGHFRVPPGEHRIEILLEEVEAGPKARRLDLSRIDAFRIFLRNWNQAPTIWLDRIALEP